MDSSFWDRLDWHKDHVLLGDLVFRLQPKRGESWELDERCFGFCKTKLLVEQYRRFWMRHPDFRANNVFELGILDGGSVAFWFEYFQPIKHVAIDISDRANNPYFTQWADSRGLGDRVRTYWNTDQSDKSRLLELYKAEFEGPLDLVIDDASHMYGLTKASFEALFPTLRPGGLYIIEDWAWSHWKEFHNPNHPWAHEIELTRLICELVEATGSSTTLVNSLHIYQGFAVIERGDLEIDTKSDFRLETHISRRPTRIGIKNILKRLLDLHGRVFRMHSCQLQMAHNSVAASDHLFFRRL